MVTLAVVGIVAIGGAAGYGAYRFFQSGRYKRLEKKLKS